MKKVIDLIGVQMDLGCGTRGVAMGPMAIRYAGIQKGLEAEGHEVHDKGDILQKLDGATSESLRNYEAVLDVNEKLYHSVKETLEAGKFPVVLGGDHSIAAGSIAATSKHYGNIGIIWIDAHGDWNDDKSSPSGNMHGMPFSAACGHGPDCMVNFGQGPVYVDPKHCVQIGGRDIDSIERIRMKEAGVTVFPINEVDKLGMSEVIRRAIEIAGCETEGIHLSFDVDAITPEAAPGTGTIVHSGLTVREAFLAVETLSESGKLLAVDMVEVNPVLDVKNQTAVLASELVQSCFGKVVY